MHVFYPDLKIDKTYLNIGGGDRNQLLHIVFYGTMEV